MSPLQKNTTLPSEIAQLKHWANNHFNCPENLPVSFTYNNQDFNGIPDNWLISKKFTRLDANIHQIEYEGKDLITGLMIKVEILQYHDFPVVEWTAWFSNASEEPTPLIENIQAIRTTFEGDKPVLYTCNGDFYSENGYSPEYTSIIEGGEHVFSPNGGRPSDGAFPYYRVLFEGKGLTLAIGWPGQWSARFTGTSEGVQILAGQEKTCLRLYPGEKIRTPRVIIMTWEGDETRSINLWRRWYISHVIPRPNGAPLQPKLAVCGTDEGEEFTAANESNQLEFIQRFQDRGIHFDVWWIDAGWYPCYNEQHERRWWITGNWIPDPERFPNGFLPISKLAETKNADLLVWFEPERVRPGTWLDREHPDWLLRSEKDDNSLLNLGNLEARKWLTVHVSNLIKENGIKIYRQDFNFPVLDHWRSNDASDRQGINENMHVQGYLQYWDDLLLENPGLWIDSCSSGGRRNDIETMRRSVPLHYTDYGYGFHPVKLAFHRTLFEWIPYFKEATLSWDVNGIERFDHIIDSYSLHCAITAMLFLTIDIRRDHYDFALASKLIAIWRRAAEFLLFGDYYPLTPFHKESEEWVSYQFERPELKRGFVQAIRLPDAQEPEIIIKMKNIKLEAHYQFKDPESGQMRVISGDELLDGGFRFALPTRSGQIWFYSY